MISTPHITIIRGSKKQQPRKLILKRKYSYTYLFAVVILNNNFYWCQSSMPPFGNSVMKKSFNVKRGFNVSEFGSDANSLVWWGRCYRFFIIKARIRLWREGVPPVLRTQGCSARCYEERWNGRKEISIGRIRSPLGLECELRVIWNKNT